MSLGSRTPLALALVLAPTLCGCGADAAAPGTPDSVGGAAPLTGLDGAPALGGGPASGSGGAAPASGGGTLGREPPSTGGGAVTTGGAAAGGSSGAPPTSGGTTSGGTSSGGAATGATASGGTPPTSGGSGTGGGGEPPTSAWRPYSDASPWNTPIAADARLDPNSAALIDDFQNSSQYGEHLDVNLGGYSIPLFWADSGTPKVTVSCRVGGHGFSGDNGMNATALIPMPAGAAPDPESDHHLLIVDRSTNTEYGLWDAQDGGGTWTCGLGALQDLSGDGVRPLATEANPWWEAHGPRACGFGLVAGLIRPEEIQAGRIDHALVVAYPHIRAGWFVPPASTAQAANGAGAQADRGIPCGGRIQYDPSIDVDALDVSPAGKAILRALQRYGAYVGDYSGAISLYADNSPGAREYWDSIGFGSYELDGKIDLADFRVLEIGQMYDNGNG